MEDLATDTQYTVIVNTTELFILANDREFVNLLFDPNWSHLSDPHS